MPRFEYASGHLREVIVNSVLSHYGQSDGALLLCDIIIATLMVILANPVPFVYYTVW